MLAEDMRRLAEEIAVAYEERVRSITELKAETADKLADFRADLEDSNRERAKTVRAELQEMGDKLRSDLSDFRSGLAGFKADLDDAVFLENARVNGLLTANDEFVFSLLSHGRGPANEHQEQLNRQPSASC